MSRTFRYDPENARFGYKTKAKAKKISNRFKPKPSHNYLEELLDGPKSDRDAEKGAKLPIR